LKNVVTSFGEIVGLQASERAKIVALWDGGTSSNMISIHNLVEASA
jgi:hypothetical protein